MYKFYFPFYYLFFSRLKTKVDMFSWFIIFIIPPMIISFYYSDISWWHFCLLFLLSEVIFNALYEIGYIENDISTIKNEKKPTLRLDQHSFVYLQKNYSKVVRIRYITVVVGIWLLYWIDSVWTLNLRINWFVGLLVINRLFFYWHNHIRNRWNLLTFSVLAITKYIFPIVLFIHDDTLLVSFYVIILFPLLRVIEHSTHKRYQFVRYAEWIGNHDRFRVTYYLVMISLVMIGYVAGYISREYIYPFLLLLSYFLGYRLFSFFMVKKGIYRRDDLKNKDLYIK